jgi:hypothetical protein
MVFDSGLYSLIALAAVAEERRRAGETARNNEERLTLALNAAQMGTDWHISDGSVILSDATRMFGLNGTSRLRRRSRSTDDPSDDGSQ